MNSILFCPLFVYLIALVPYICSPAVDYSAEAKQILRAEGIKEPSENEMKLAKKIVQKDSLIGLTTCARRVRNGVKLIEYKYMAWEFVRHFWHLKLEIIRAVFPQCKNVQEWSDDYLDEIVYQTLKKMSHFQRFSAFLSWLAYSNEYIYATSDQILKLYRNGRLASFAEEVRKLVENGGKRISVLTIAEKFRMVLKNACRTAKHDAVDESDLERLSDFVEGTLKLFAGDKLADKCRIVIDKVFSEAHHVTSEERNILVENDWFS